jgi:hypothetical protein
MEHAGTWFGEGALQGVLAQASAPSGASPGASGGAGAAAAIVLVVGLLAIIGAGVALYDRKRRRESEAVHLQAQASEALLRDPALFGLPVTATARIPYWSGTPAIVELAGQVPDEALHETAVRIAREAALHLRPDVQIEDRIGVVPAGASRVA